VKSPDLNSCLYEDGFLTSLRRKAAEAKIPLSASLELTHRCNLQCVHCCHAPNEGIPVGSMKEKPTEFWKDHIDQLVDMGCLYLLITGGEPLLRADFLDIYRYAKDQGLLVTVFSNATLINDEHLALFDELPPHSVEISLYGATAETYESITGIPGSYDACLRGIDLLVSKGVRVFLRSMILTTNEHEFDEMHAVATRNGLPFRADFAVFPRFSGDRSPTSYRVDSKSAVALEMKLPQAKMKHEKSLERERSRSAKRLYECSAGRTNLNISPDGILQPCLMLSNPSADICEEGLSLAWGKIGKVMDGKLRNPESECNGCELKPLCNNCPAFSRLDANLEQGKSDYHCALGRERLMAING